MFQRCWVLSMTLNCSYVCTFFLPRKSVRSFMPNVVLSCSGGYGSAVPLQAGPMGVQKTVPMIMADSRVSFAPREVGRGATDDYGRFSCDLRSSRRWAWCISPRRDSTSGIGASLNVRRYFSPRRDSTSGIGASLIVRRCFSPRRDSTSGIGASPRVRATCVAGAHYGGHLAGTARMRGAGLRV